MLAYFGISLLGVLSNVSMALLLDLTRANQISALLWFAAVASVAMAIGW